MSIPFAVQDESVSFVESIPHGVKYLLLVGLVWGSVAGCAAERPDESRSHTEDVPQTEEPHRDERVPQAAASFAVPPEPPRSSYRPAHVMPYRPSTPHPIPDPAGSRAAKEDSIHAPSVGTFQPIGNGRMRYTAPEDAYTVEVPGGWRVQTYIDRSSPNGTIPWTIFTSADGQIVMRAPDAAGASYVRPDPRLARYEGQRSGPFLVRRFASTHQYAAGHAQRIAQQIGCRGGQVVEQRDRPTFVQKMWESLPPRVAQTFSQIFVGEALLRCQRESDSLFILAGASVFFVGPTGGWLVSTSSLLSPVGRYGEARRAIDLINETMVPNPDWMEREFIAAQRRAAEAERAIAARRAASGRLSSSLPSSSESSLDTGASSTSDDGHRALIHSIHGTQDLTDRFGDTVYGVESTASHHWQDTQGNIVGTTIDQNPNPLEYTRLTSGGGY